MNQMATAYRGEAKIDLLTELLDAFPSVDCVVAERGS